MAANNGIPIVAVSKRDGSIIRRFDSTRQAAAWGECDEHIVSKQSRRLTLGPTDYMWRREEAWTGREVFNPKTKNRPVVVMTQGHLLWFNGPMEAAVALRAPARTLTRGGRLSSVEVEYGRQKGISMAKQKTSLEAMGSTRTAARP